MGLVGFPGSLQRYMSGLCVATLGLCAAGWLALAPVAFGYRSVGRPEGALHRAALTDWATAAGLAGVSLVTLVSWVVAWRRTLRADGILPRTSRRQARREARALRRRERDGEAVASTPDPAQVLSELRALLIPLLAEPANGQAATGPAVTGPAVTGQQANGLAANGLAAGAHVSGAHVSGVQEPGDGSEEPGEPDAGHPEQDDGEPGHYTPSGEPDDQAYNYQPLPGTPAGSAAPGGPGTPARPGMPAGNDMPAVPHARSGGLAAMESMLAGTELLMVGCGEEEAW
jgi:hypothetical protein